MCRVVQLRTDCTWVGAFIRLQHCTLDCMDSTTEVAAYVRASTHSQGKEHQWDALCTYVDSEVDGCDWAEVTKYVDTESGAKEREQFTELMEDVQAGKYDVVVAWELSRLSRDGETLQRFLNVCEDTGTVVRLTDDNVDEIRPDGTGRFLANIISAVYEQERRSLIRRTKAGVRRAQQAGKWTGAVPAGFTRTDTGRLRPSMPDDEGDSYWDIQRALERVERGDSYRSVAQTVCVSRATLSRIHDERAHWYLEQEADDERVERALESITD